MNVPKPVQFPEYTNAGINAALVADKLNEVICFLNEKYPEANVFKETRQLRPGVEMTSRGSFFKSGKGGGFVRKEDAYV
jgi:hypothetical protein